MLRITTLIVLFSPISALFICRRQIRALDACHNEKDGCADCKIIGPPSNLLNGFCDAANDSLCSASGCCEGCEEEFNEYETCLNEVNFFNCDLGNCPEEQTEGEQTDEEQLEEEFEEEMESQGCLQKFGEFAECAAQNPLLCGSCFIESIPDDTSGVGLCSLSTEAICGFGTCCEPCAAEFTEFDQCFETIVADVTFGACEIDCDDYEAPADEGNDNILGGCGDALESFTDCVEENPLTCALCVIQNFPNPDDGFCQGAEDSICGLGECCTPCATEFDDLETCVKALSSLVSLGQCEVDCSDNEPDRRGLRNFNQK